MAQRERPILFSGAMIQAILSGDKTQTRRVMKPQPYADVRQSGMSGLTKPCNVWEPRKTTAWFDWGNGFDPMMWTDGPYHDGDLLWVRETWRRSPDDMPDGICYRADNCISWFGGSEDSDRARFCVSIYPRDGKWRPSIFMPRWASRLTLEIIGVRVERVQEISIDDVLDEGVEKDMSDTQYWRENTGARFAALWDSINGKRGYGWETNPFVWCINFKRI
jgi:hypothetical protein